MLLFGLIAVVAAVTQPTVATPHRSVTVPAGEAKRAEVHLRLPEGSVTLSSGEGELIKGRLYYGETQDQPRLFYDLQDTKAKVKIEGQPGGNQWELKLTRDLPIDLNYSSEKGSQDIDLEGIKIRKMRLNVDQGTTILSASGQQPALTEISAIHQAGLFSAILAGSYPSLSQMHVKTTKTTISMDLVGTFSMLRDCEISSKSGDISMDLTGTWMADNHIDISSESGAVSVVVPSDVGVMVRASSTSGKVSAPGMNLIKLKDQEIYVNSTYQKSPVKLTVDVHTVNGNIALSVGTDTIDDLEKAVTGQTAPIQSS